MSAKVLVVDDSTMARRLVRQLMEELGHVVDEAGDGMTALERYFISRPDLVVIDMVMSGMYGLDVLAKLRELDPTARVIVASADIQRSTLEQVRAGGAAAFVNKPINRSELARIVGEVLKGGHGWN